MRVFFLFLGYALGFAFAASGEWVSRLLAFLVALAFFALSFARKTTKPFLLSLSIGLLVGFLLPFPIPLGRSNLLGMVVKRGENYLILQGMRGKVYVALREHSYQIGDWVKIEGEIENLYMTNYESRFDFGVYLRRLGVEKQMRNGTVLSDFRFPIRVIEWEKKYLQSYDNTTSTLLSSILFNRRDETQGILRLLSDSNLLYLFSASGIIFGKTLSFARVLIRKFTSKDRVADACLLLLAFLFLPLAARKIGIAKVLVVHSVSFLSLHVLKRAWSRLEILSVSALLMAIVSPFSLFQTGFLLSFGIELFLLFLPGPFPERPLRFRAQPSVGLLRPGPRLARYPSLGGVAPSLHPALFAATDPAPRPVCDPWVGRLFFLPPPLLASSLWALSFALRGTLRAG